MTGTIRCSKCDAVILKEGACPKCRGIRCYILIYWKKKAYKIRRDKKTGEPLQYLKALDLLLEINRQIRKKTFNIYDWISSKLNETSFGYKLEQWLKAKEEDVKTGEFSPTTLKNYKGYVKNYYKRFKIDSNGNGGWTNNKNDPQLLINWNVNEIRKSEIVKFKKELLKVENLKLKTKKNILNGLHAFFTWLAIEDPDELISKKDIPDFPKLIGDDSEPRKAIDYETQIQGIKNIPEAHRDIIEFGCEEFLRPGELCALKIKDLDLKNKIVIVRRTWAGSVLKENTKQKKWKIKPLTEIAYKIAIKHAQNRFPEEFLFINQETKRPYRPKTLNEIWKNTQVQELCFMKEPDTVHLLNSLKRDMILQQ
ncbi:tyrosine-type recombinase/integrase [Thermodesulfovibrio yellowstonii]|uniref:tyrosine-type recombinase/integrase n=1 Tax=Thermodesulfovibrio yellowstonii TaxID=28262 RepID=UPI003F83EAFE